MGMDDKIANLQSLRRLLVKMDIPEQRLREMDIRWLRRNLGFKNNNHPDFDKAINLIKIISRQ